METVKLQAKRRDMSEKAKDRRKEGYVTAEYYGKGVENQQLLIDYQGFRRAYREAGKSTVMELEIDGEDKIYALIHEVDYHPVTDEYMHIDLIHVDLNKEISAKIPFEFVGEAPAVREQQGTFMSALDGVEVKCIARDLISSIEIDVSGLVEFSDAIKVSDLKLPEGFVLVTDPEETVATVLPPKEEEEEEIVVAEGEEGAEGSEGAEGEEGAEGAEGGEGSAEGGEEKKEEGGK
ncbi:50S ribosomal protein L25 [Candidatus Peregrinibacteria bacterium]|jgi:large subunit ribosomal protein L25|nr:50S ribosomal protein L25 [Candidatus Peregrinibacteria bacterium]MBT4148510.1 50S ribosomal protein L25 [Candidatus Peregrinibacteria bacterium]MBT4366709.1 50S ribosomal protein L25 [Candidatus Peregrinibacteria bacterium]MBT4455522.1 50S ribosomal protein L25 [Candidatus Peregrinibacteria bacterium]